MSYAIIRPKRGTASEWLNADPILRDGEIGIETCPEGTGKGMCRIKFGDGISKWSELPYGICPESYFANVGTDGLVTNAVFAPVAEQVEVNKTTISSLATSITTTSNKATQNANAITAVNKSIASLQEEVDAVASNASGAQANGINTYTHSKSNTVHTLTGTGDNIKFVAAGTYNKGDKFSVNGKTVTIATQNGEELEDKFFVAGGMVQCFLNGNTLNFRTGGAGTALNFKIVNGTTQPTSPSENTVWVNTATAISKWTIKSSIDTAVAGSSGEVVLVAKLEEGFNIIKGDNAVYIVPVKAYQYVSGSWVQKDVSYYDGSAWKECGIIFGDVTAWTAAGSTKVSVVEGGVRIECVTASEYSHATLNEPIDLTGVKSVELTVGAVNGNMGSGFYTLFTLTEEIPTGNIYATGDVGIINGVGTVTINTESLSGEHYLTVQAGYQAGTYIDVTGISTK